jgi:lysine-arginine-ornithine-binding protein
MSYSVRSRISSLKIRALIALCALLALSGAALAQQKLRIATEGANPPFSMISASGELQGFDVDIARALCAKMGAECEVVAQDFDGIIPALLAKKIDIIVASLNITEERKHVVAFTKPYYQSPSVFLTKKSTAAASKGISPDALRGKSIGAQGSTNHATFLEDKYPHAILRIYNTVADAYRDLAAGRVEYVLYDKLPSYDWLKTPEGSCCEIVGAEQSDPAYFGSGVGIALRQGDDALLKQLNDAIDAIRADGTYEKINAKYFPFSIY